MDKISSRLKEIKELQIKKAELEKLIFQMNGECNEKKEEVAKAYEEFFARKENKEFVLYERFPSMQALNLYFLHNRQFPFYEYGKLNIKELSEIIKYLYQFKTGKEFQILTIGTVEKDFKETYGSSFAYFIPHLFFMIGSHDTLKPFFDYNGQFVNDYQLFYQIYLDTKCKNLITLDAEKDLFNFSKITCNVDSLENHPSFMNYYDESQRKVIKFGVDLEKQIFTSSPVSSLSYRGGHKMGSIKDVINFHIHPFDSYIAKVLISIIIYKRNNFIQDLKNEDYAHIFDVLFGEKIDIANDVSKDIPLELKYVPNSKTGY